MLANVAMVKTVIEFYTNTSTFTLLRRISFCKRHFLEFVKVRVRKEIRLVYRDPESAYAALDFSGSGKISIDSILNNLIVQRLGIGSEDIKGWLLMDKVFKKESDLIEFDSFKKSFFPHLCQIENNEDFDIEYKNKLQKVLIDEDSP